MMVFIDEGAAAPQIGKGYASAGAPLQSSPRLKTNQIMDGMPSKIQPELEPLAAEARKYKNADEFIKEVSGQNCGLLFHGTSRGNEITKFNLEKANWGVGSNVWAQGNKGVYLTNDLQAARYFSRKAGEFIALMDRTIDPIQRNEMAWQALFGDEDGNIVITRLKPDVKIKELTHYPWKEEIEPLSKQGFAGVRFPEKGFASVEDFPSDKVGNKSPFSSKTTFVFDPEVIQVIQNKFNLADFYKLAISQPTSNLSQLPMVDEQTALNSARR